jgi:hypothetical protein
METYTMNNRIRAAADAAAVILLLSLALPAAAQGPSEAELAAANNPLAEISSLTLQNYFVPSLAGTDGSANTFWLRYARPVGPFLVRASLPLPTVPVADQPDSISGVGDFNVFAAYLAISRPDTTFGVGPLLATPSATDDPLGTGKWQGGAAAVLFKAPTPELQFGGLLTWQASFAGDEARGDTNVLAAQPFLIFQIGGGTYLRSVPIWVFDLENDTYHVPFGFGIGKVFKSGGMVYNIFIEPQFTILHKGVGQPLFQVLTGLNLQFGG